MIIFGSPWRLLEAKHHTATAHFGTLTQFLVHSTVPKRAVAVWCVAFNSLHGGQKLVCLCYHARHLQQIHRSDFFVGCMVWWPNRLLQHLTTMSLINKISGCHITKSPKLGEPRILPNLNDRRQRHLKSNHHHHYTLKSWSFKLLVLIRIIMPKKHMFDTYLVFYLHLNQSQNVASFL